MTTNEIFPNPTVQKVHFEVRFPDLFTMEKLIGDYQLKIMERFPESKLIFEQKLLLANSKVASGVPDESGADGGAGVHKIWCFSSPDGVEINVRTNSVTMASTLHKTYNNNDVDERFRDAIQFALDKFLEIVSIPKITRIGLRYIDECPILEKTTSFLQTWYKTAFPLERFALDDALTMKFETVTKKDDCFLKFSESFQDDNSSLKYVLDFDGFATNINASDYLTTTDTLHDVISEEFKKCGNAPFFSYLRGE